VFMCDKGTTVLCVQHSLTVFYSQFLRRTNTNKVNTQWPRPQRRPVKLSWGEGWRSDDLYCDRWAVQPPVMYRTACPGKDLLSCKLLAIPSAAAVDY